METMRTIRLSRLAYRAGIEYGYTDNAVRNLIDDFENGKVQACRARKEYARLRVIWVIDGQRYARLKSAQMGEEKEKYFDAESLSKYDKYFGKED